MSRLELRAADGLHQRNEDNMEQMIGGKWLRCSTADLERTRTEPQPFFPGSPCRWFNVLHGPQRVPQWAGEGPGGHVCRGQGVKQDTANVLQRRLGKTELRDRWEQTPSERRGVRSRTEVTPAVTVQGPKDRGVRESDNR